MNNDFENAIEVLQIVLNEIKENGEEWADIDNADNVKFDLEDLVDLIDYLDLEELLNLNYVITTKIEYEKAKKRVINS